MAGASLGEFPEIAAALPRLEDGDGLEVNPLPTSSSPTTLAGALDPIGFSYGFNDRFDVGLSFSRGLYSFVQIAGDDTRTLSLSPAVFRRT